MMEVSVQEVLGLADPNNLLSVESAVQQARSANLDGFVSVPIFFLSNFTISGIEPFLEYHGLRSDLKIQVGLGDYNVIHQSLMRKDSALHAFSPKIVVISLMYDVIDQPGEADVCSNLRELLELAAAKISATIILNTFISPSFRDTVSSPGDSKPTRIQSANSFLRQFVKENSSKFYLCDWDQYVQAFGYSQTIDRRYWFMAKAPFKPPFLSLYSADIAKIARAVLGLSKKCLVIDCDNTLWGGVLGEEGADGIHLHPDDYPGNVFYEVQRSLIDLQKRGILLVINSKNNEPDVLNVLENHPHCLLKKRHFSAYRINWGNKTENMVDLAAELNLGLDSFVFMDDSDFECNFVKSRLPAVDVRQVPKRLYEYPDFVSAFIDELFFSASQTNEDALRAQMYLARKKADVAKASFDDIETYLRSLNITADMHEMHLKEIPRVAQLTQKTSQFNLVKTVYSEGDITGFHNNPDQSVYVMVVSDRFGELGLTNVCIVRGTDTGEAIIDTFLMSCRVFERNLEYVFLDYVIGEVVENKGCSTIRAGFKRTNRNSVAERFYEKAGFSVEREDDQDKFYVIDVSDYEPKTIDYIRRV